MKLLPGKKNGFTLIEMALVISIIGIFSMIAYAGYSEARAESRDKARAASLQQLQLALELYKDKYGRYPAEGCGDPNDVFWSGPGTHPGWGNANDCPEYILGLVPEFMSALPRDPKDEMVHGRGFIYRTNSGGTAYKALVHYSVETNLVTSYSNEFARCPSNLGSHCLQSTVYAIYSAGAESW